MKGLHDVQISDDKGYERQSEAYTNGRKQMGLRGYGQSSELKNETGQVQFK